MNKHAIFVEYLADVKVFTFLQKTKWQANVMKLPVVKFQAPVSWAWKLLQLFSAWGRKWLSQQVQSSIHCFPVQN